MTRAHRTESKSLPLALALLLLGPLAPQLEAQELCDGLWKVWSFGCDFGHNNFGPLNPDGTPTCGSSNCAQAPGQCWQGGWVSASGNTGGVQWTTGAEGEFAFTHTSKDVQALAQTWMYVLDAPKTISASFQSNVGGLWVNGVLQPASGGNVQMHFPQVGWNRVEITAYSQNSSGFADLSAPFASSVHRISSTQVELCAPGSITLYGCGINPPGSLSVSGLASLGEQLTFSIDNPLGTNAVFSASLLLASPLSDPGFPCGLQLAGYGMAPPDFTGELLVGLIPPLSGMIVATGPLWTGTGPVPIQVPIPLDSSLAGVDVYFQGALVDNDPLSPAGIGLTEAAQVSLGG